MGVFTEMVRIKDDEHQPFGLLFIFARHSAPRRAASAQIASSGMAASAFFQGFATGFFFERTEGSRFSLKA